MVRFPDGKRTAAPWSDTEAFEMSTPSRPREPKTSDEAIRSHWKPRGDLSFIRKALDRKGLEPNQATLEQLAVHDQLHSGQLQGTLDFLEWAAVSPSSTVLDLGAGMGGAARLLARDHRCEVTAVELCPELVEGGQELTRWRGLEGQVEHVCASVLEYEPSKTYDLVWIQHTDIHIQNKVALYERCRRWVRPQGRVLWHDWLLGPDGDPRYPMPWSTDGAISHLIDEGRFWALLDEVGLVRERFQDKSLETAEYFRRSRRGIHKARERTLAKGIPEKHPRAVRLRRLEEDASNVIRNIEERRLVAIYAEATRRKEAVKRR